MSKKVIITFLVMAYFSFLLFPFVTDLKFARHAGVSVTDTSNVSMILKERPNRGGGISGIMIAGANRLNGVAPVTVVMSFPENHFGKLLSISNVLKQVINKLLPGFTPFPDIINSARTFNAIIFDFSLNHIIDNYQSRAYTLWGISYAHFGWWGGLIAIFLMAFLLSVVYQCLAKIKSNFNVLLRVWFIMIVYGWLKNFGFDVWITSQFMFLGSGISFIVIMSLLRSLKYNIRPQLRNMFVPPAQHSKF